MLNQTRGSRSRAWEVNPGRGGPTSMREPLSRPEQDEHGTSQTSIRHHPRLRSAMRQYAVAPIHTSGVALRHVRPAALRQSEELRHNLARQPGGGIEAKSGAKDGQTIGAADSPGCGKAALQPVADDPSDFVRFR